MREETQPQDTCFYCGKPIAPDDRPIKRLASGEEAHLSCYVEHLDEEENDLGR